MQANELAARLHAKRTAGAWLARCPSHDDRRPSLSISEGREDRVLLHCHAGCPPEAIAAALGLTLSDLFSDSQRSTMPLRTVTRKTKVEQVDEALKGELARILDREEQRIGFRPPALAIFKNEARTSVERRLRIKLSRHRIPWWEVLPGAEDPQWRACVDRAVEEAAWKNDVEPSWLHENLEGMPSVLDGVLVRARQLQRELAVAA